MKKLVIFFIIILFSIPAFANPEKRLERKKARIERYMKKFPHRTTLYQKEKYVKNVLVGSAVALTIIIAMTQKEENY